MRNVRVRMYIRNGLRVITVCMAIFLLVEIGIRWLPADKIVVTTTWNNGISTEYVTETYTTPQDSRAVAQINAAFNHDNSVLPPPVLNTLCSGTIPQYAAEQYTVTFSWHGLTTQVWHKAACQEWIRTSGGVMDPWGRAIVPYDPPHLEHD